MPKVELHFQAIGDEVVYQKGKKLADLLKDLNKPVSASFGGQLFPVEKHAQAFGAWTRQLNQGMRELRPALKEYERMLATGFAGMKWNFPSQATPRGVNWRQIAVSAAIAPFHPWVAARGIAGALGGGGGGGHGAGAVAGGLFGGSFLRFEAALVAITAAIHAVHAAFRELHRSIEHGTHLFESAAHVGNRPGKLAGLEGALGSIGISQTQAERLLVRGEYPLKSGGKSVKLGDFMLGSGRGVFQAGELQQVKNLIDYINIYGQRGAHAFAQMGANARAAFEITFAMKNVTREWDGLMSQLVADIGPALVKMFRDLEDVVKAISIGLRFVPVAFSSILGILSAANPLIEKWNQMIGTTPGNQKDFKGGILGGTGSASRMNMSGLERMGFVIGYGGGSDYARQTAENTKDASGLLNQILKVMSGDITGLQPFSKPNSP